MSVSNVHSHPLEDGASVRDGVTVRPGVRSGQTPIRTGSPTGLTQGKIIDRYYGVSRTRT